MIALLLGSHGKFAKEALESAKMIVGEQENTTSFSLEENMDLKMTIDSAQDAFNTLNTSEGVLLLTDIMGGTPTNVSTVIHKKNPNTRLLAGFNLPILVEALLNRSMELDELVDYLKEQFPGTLSDVS
ncbi:hypothetical protein GCM10025886_24710 [Tetragenococcus halophilus subsp. flandriensis]|uniref:PTS sugar transporter subunit IIA n=1 Tax=Tetragenococcus halophilus TaxID=51669 RepID=UPI0023E94028|nr:PTS sugar transporter subunit IIA [Tetragenococcus halophilus]GMA09318.1 hypothetical protein GCM10025886_24710 [Tetragenococcus halophilus subsp. flandriensis]